MSLIQKSSAVSMMQYSNYILFIALMYEEILMEIISTQYLFYKLKLCELSLMLGHWTILLKSFLH